MTDAATVFVGLGGNVGERREHLRAAVAGLSATPRVEVEAVSRIYETRPVGPSTRPFLNASARLRTTLDPFALLDVCLAIERTRGRVRTERWAARTLDLDLLAWLDGDEPRRLDDPRLTLPHPRAAGRDFVLVPLADVAETHRLFGEQTVAALMDRIPPAERTVLGPIDAGLR